jgi:C4-dicarboxylate-specific signal transduction histidine kinase
VLMAELTHLNRVSTAGVLSASIAHEVNQPLTAIATMASAARRLVAAERLDVERVRDVLNQIEAASHRASEIVGNVKLMFRKESHDKAQVDVNKVIRAVMGLMSIDLRKHQIELKMELNDQLPPVLAEHVQLQQVILNLVMNAIDAMHLAQPRTLSVKSELSGRDSVHVSIQDTGIGINPANIDKIFTPLFTTKAAGMGMGLAICQSIIEGHGGRIWVTPAPNRGSIFQLELPIAPA